MRYIDANVFVRYITGDQPAMTEAATRLFERIDAGQEHVAVLDSTVAEVVYVLGSTGLYRLSGEQIRDRLLPLLMFEGLHLENKQRCVKALELNAANSAVNFADALVASAALEQPEGEIYSFDLGFERVSGVKRVEP